MRATSKIGSTRLRRYVMFLFSGGTGFALYLLFSNLLHYRLGVSEAYAAASAVLLAVFPTFLLQKYLTFRSGASSRRAFPLYFLLQVANAALTGAVSGLGASAAVPGYLTFVIAGVTGVLVSYWVQSRFIFGKVD